MPSLLPLLGPPNPPAHVPYLQGFTTPPVVGTSSRPPQNVAPPASPAKHPCPSKHLHLAKHPCSHPQRAPHRQLNLHKQYFPALLTLMHWKDGRVYQSPRRIFSLSRQIMSTTISRTGCMGIKMPMKARPLPFISDFILYWYGRAKYSPAME